MKHLDLLFYLKINLNSFFVRFYWWWIYLSSECGRVLRFVLNSFSTRWQCCDFTEKDFEDNVGEMTLCLSTLIQRSWEKLKDTSFSYCVVSLTKNKCVEILCDIRFLFLVSLKQLLSYVNQDIKYTLYLSIQTDKTLLWYFCLNKKPCSRQNILSGKEPPP
jgi:hypothetical protein